MAAGCGRSQIVTSAAEAAPEKQSAYRSAKALRHPKSDFFRSLLEGK